jgi:hypothetical protein
MTSLLPLLMLVVLFVCMATLYNEGMWSNAVRLINVVTAALLATNFFEPAARLLDGKLPAGSYAWDFLALWLLFAVFLLIVRTATDWVSRVKVRFHKIADQIGGGFFALWTSWVMICFIMMTLHTAPLARNFLFGGFQPEQRMLVFGPDRQWLGFMQKESLGAFRRSVRDEEQQKYRDVLNPNVESKYAVFDADNAFLPKYASRRANFAKHMAEFDSILVGSGPGGAPPAAPH